MPFFFFDILSADQATHFNSLIHALRISKPKLSNISFLCLCDILLFKFV